MNQFQNYCHGEWVSGTGTTQELFNAVNGTSLGFAGSGGLDFKAMCNYARETGGPALRKLTFHERGRMLKALALYLLQKKERYYEISWATGATRADSWVDIEGGIGNLFAYASLRRQFPNESYCYDGEAVKLSKSNTFIGHHICVPKEGVAVHINAYNFPVWGMLEKVSVNWLAGVPAIVKPATLTCFLTEAVVRDIIDSEILPKGALQLICGSAGDLLNHLENQDIVTFTGSASTGKKLKSHHRIIEESIPFNMEADSLNACVLGPDVQPKDPEFSIFIKEVVREMCTKAGQKCTAVRRILVPLNRVEEVQTALIERLKATSMGDPKIKEVRMGALAAQSQRTEVQDKIQQLKTQQELLFENLHPELLGAEVHQGAFLAPTLMYNPKPLYNTLCHSVEAFGPVSTLMPYTNLDEAIQLCKMGKGSLVSSIITNDATLARQFTLGAACMHGRILVLNRDCAAESTGHGSPMPLLVHGGPGRAGGGEEMGGVRGVFHYLQRTAIQGSPTTVGTILNQYQYGGQMLEKVIHPFQQYFEDLEIGETLITSKHTVTDADVVQFANVSGDHFYAHVDVTSLEGTLFTGRVAHGYYLLSKAAGLFVDGRKGPVLLNYGIESCKFLKPVYMGTTIGVRFTCKEKIEQEKKTAEEVAKGIVKWQVDVYDDQNDTVALATILTMIKKRNQN